MEIIKQRFAEHIALAQQVAASGILEQVAASAAIIKKALKMAIRFYSAVMAAVRLTVSI